MTKFRVDNRFQVFFDSRNISGFQLTLILGPEKHKQNDFLDFKDRADIRRQYPYLHRWVMKRQKDQEWGRKYFPVFPGTAKVEL